MKKQPSIKTLGELKQSGYAPKSLKTELRTNLIHHMERGTNPFSGIIGYDETVLPDVQRAILSGHSINLLGLRGQAKTRIARTLTALLDEWIPCIDGSELNDDPLQPISHAAHDALELHGDLTPIRWMHRADRYVEKLATPDVSVADLIGDIDPIKAANMKLNYSDEDKEIRLSGYDDFVFQESDAGEVRPEPVPDPTMEVAFRDYSVTKMQVSL